MKTLNLVKIFFHNKISLFISKGRLFYLNSNFLQSVANCSPIITHDWKNVANRLPIISTLQSNHYNFVFNPSALLKKCFQSRLHGKSNVLNPIKLGFNWNRTQQNLYRTIISIIKHASNNKLKYGQGSFQLIQFCVVKQPI